MTTTHTDPTWTAAVTGRVYYAQHPTTGEFIAIRHNEPGYYASTVYTQDHADTLNQRQGITPAELDAAIVCSMFDNWRDFAKITARMEDRQQ